MNLENTDDILSARRRNQVSDFRQQSIAQFRRLELLFLRELEANMDLRLNPNHKFASLLDKINLLLDHVEIRMEEFGVKAYNKKTGSEISSEHLSSGEAELITLGIELLSFTNGCHREKFNLLLLDEPDVHLHPDQQEKLASFLVDLIQERKFQVIITTHSTAFVGALGQLLDTRIAFMKSGITNLKFTPISNILRSIIPVFGAHPLSNIFNQNPILLLEGDDDVRIWQQAVRSSSGRIKLYPCSADGNRNLVDFEKETAKILDSLYDYATGYSLRDRDDGEVDIGDAGPMKRMKLTCRASENLLLTDEVLSVYKITWSEMEVKLIEWIDRNEGHKRHGDMQKFQFDGFDRLNANLKSVRLIVVSILDSSKPWEVAIGQAIANLDSSSPVTVMSLRTFLGPKVCKELLKLSQANLECCARADFAQIGLHFRLPGRFSWIRLYFFLSASN